ncbi:ABC transporter permease [bacterium]|nr:ABC transporter permease [bacterium]
MTDWIISQSTKFFTNFGRVTVLLGRILLNLRFVYADRKNILIQSVLLGYNSLPMVLLIGIFTGAVSAWQANYQFEGYIPIKFLGSAVYKAVIIELGPVMTGLVIAGRVSASIAAELGSMRITEQVDALESLAIDPIRFLAMPRFLATTMMMPVMVTLASFIAVMGGFGVAHIFLGVTSSLYFTEIPRHFLVYDIFVCLIKALYFGAITSLMGCYIGLSTEGGAEGVGKATIEAFVWSSLLILFGDYILATIFF